MQLLIILTALTLPAAELSCHEISSGLVLETKRWIVERWVVEYAEQLFNLLHVQVTYRTEFIGALSPEDGAHPETPVARVLSATSDDPAVYTFTGNELYVRARVTSSRPHPRPYAKGDLEMAWTQPVRPPRTGDDDAPRSDTPPTIDPEPSESDR
ncbi:MAG: hypothetical protein ACO3EP_06380 [Phycisphaerales bacterium]